LPLEVLITADLTTMKISNKKKAGQANHYTMKRQEKKEQWQHLQDECITFYLTEEMINRSFATSSTIVHGPQFRALTLSKQ